MTVYMQVAAAKVTLAARCDVHGTDGNAATGLKFRAELEAKVRIFRVHELLLLHSLTQLSA
jgi:RNA processing factor Prp31